MNAVVESQKAQGWFSHLWDEHQGWVVAGGLLLVSTRTHYYDRTNFQAVVDDLASREQVELLRVIRDAPYNNDGDGHYWVMRKLA